MSRRCPSVVQLALVTGAAALGVIGPSWSNPAWAAGPTAHKPHVAHHISLSGKWSGSYSGSFSGTFKLTWQQSGQDLSGMITISGFKDAPTSINGTVHGTVITFGTVGSESVTYSGSASASSMSGTWKIQAGGRSLGGGSWTASKSG